MTSDVAIRLATRNDIPGLLALSERYYVGNLTPTQQAEGFLSVLLPEEWFTWAIGTSGVHVAVTDDGQFGDAVVGFVGMTDPPIDGQAGSSPIVRAMLDLAETLEFNGRPIAQQRFAFRGPVCIDESARGRGLYSKFNAVTGAAYRDRYDLGMLFVAADNPRSMHTSTTKLGAESLAVFEAGGKQYHFLAFNF